MPPAYFDNIVLCGGGEETGGKHSFDVNGNFPVIIPDASTFRMYPNPSNGMVTIEYPMSGRVLISNSLGQSIRTEVLPEGIGSVKIDLGRLPSGIYTWQFVSNQGNMVKTGKLTLLQ